MEFLAHFENIKDYLVLIPIVFIGLLAGFIKYLNANDEDKDTKKEVFKIFVMSVFISVVCFSILTAIESLPYLAKVGISAFAGYFGIDKTIEYIQKILNLRGERK